jgi:hypothetical protein
MDTAPFKSNHGMNNPSIPSVAKTPIFFSPARKEDRADRINISTRNPPLQEGNHEPTGAREDVPEEEDSNKEKDYGGNNTRVC